jgi:tRNA G18 (ribose-2'-O)-methylase SpoU
MIKLVLNMQSIDSHLDLRLSDYKLLKTKEENTDFFIADNEKTAIRLLQSDFKIKSVFCLPKYFQKHEDLIRLRLKEMSSCFVAEKSVFESTIGYSIHQGFMAIGYKKWAELDELTSSHVLFNAIADSENIGSMIRSCVALGMKSLVFDSQCSPPYLRRSVRVSMGSIFSAKIVLTEDIKYFIENQKQKGFKIIALSLPREGSMFQNITKSLYDFIKVDKFILIVGNEADGIDLEYLSLADEILYIPMKNQIDSLNVSHALAIALSHILR